MKTIQMPYSGLAKSLGLAHDVYLKREDQHKYGSHKGRSIPLMIKNHIKSEQNIDTFVISSSGNAALAAITAISQHNKNNPGKEVTLRVFIGKKINELKKKILEQAIDDKRITLVQVERPKQEAFKLGNQEHIVNLRQSTDDSALEGYIELARELEKIPNLKAIFIPTSSGTTAQAIGQTILDMKLPIQIHIIQTTSCHPIAEAFDTAETTDVSIADCVVDQVAHRKQAVIEVIQQTNGSGWIVTNEELNATKTLVKKETNLDISLNSALSVAGLQKAIQHDWMWNGPVACLITGT
ncbi:MAG: PLP-dependent lyase/thiolase [Candidatus Magasanikbacteria bacterium]|nr:PLP-dependent lyase/thiolase [Candidatus Magasanikbacteria bacterium]